MIVFSVGSRRFGLRLPASGSAVLTLCVATMLADRPAHAAQRTSIHLAFRGVPGCDDEPALKREVELRQEAVSWLAAGPADAAVDVHLAKDPHDLRAVIAVQVAGQQSVTRAIRGSDCEEVLAGTALIIAVLVSRYEATTHPPLAPKRTAESPAPPPASVPPRQQLRWRAGAGIRGVLIVGIAPSVLPGADLLADLVAEGPVWAPAFRLTFGRAYRSGFASGDAHAAFDLISGSAEACPAAFSEQGSPWRVRPCAMARVGGLEASGSLAERHPWAVIGGGLRLEARLASTLFLEVAGYAGAPLVTSRFRFGDADRPFHETSRVTGRFDVGISFRPQ